MVRCPEQGEIFTEYEKEFLLEQQYLDKTCSFIKENLEREEASCANEKEDIISARKEMWENVSFRGGFDNAVEAHQALELIQAQSARYDASHKRIDHYKQALACPYFARINFTEAGFESEPAEKIYIGLSNIQDEDSYEAYVYDWRTPIASLFYRYETGDAEYEAPSGIIRGNISLKRQYDIQDSKLNYFFDSDLNIMDDILRDALSHNASLQMKSIVETIQRQQDMIIRDTQNELLFVQGVAGSGKTSVALHRVAFLLYEGVTQKIYANNIVIISPNNLFGSYIANVLPELGEENIASLTFEALFTKVCGRGIQVIPRSRLLEQMVCASAEEERTLLHQSVEFFSSHTFTQIIDRYVTHYVRKMIPYTDLYYDGKLLETREEMSAFVQKVCRKTTPAQALNLLEKRLWTQIHKIRRENRLNDLVSFSATFPEHLYDNKTFGRYLSIKESLRLKHQIKAFTTLDGMKIFQSLIHDKELFFRLAKGLALPENINKLLEEAQKRLEGSCDSLFYQDAIPFLYLYLKLFGTSLFSDICQVVLDEAQDYYPIHFAILSQLFPESRYTIMGDYNQTIEKKEGPEFYQQAEEILHKKSSRLITLNKGFRCSYEINEFSRRFLPESFEMESFDRHEQEPIVEQMSDEAAEADRIAELSDSYLKEGLGSVGIICKTNDQAKRLYSMLKGKLPVHLVDADQREMFSGIMLLPVYMAKGLEFDAAILCGVTKENYCNAFDKQLLYVSCTRALHRLAVLYTGEPSEYLKLK